MTAVERVRAWRKANPEKKAEAQRRYRLRKKAIKKERRAEIAAQLLGPVMPPEEKRKRRLAKIAAWQKANPGKVKASQKRCAIKTRPAYEIRNKKRIRAARLEWEAKNRDHIRSHRRQYSKRKRIESPQYRLREILRKRMLNALKWQNASKRASALDMLGCSVDDFKIYIESRWESGMTWENHGPVRRNKRMWNIDHIMPCAIFDLSNPDHVKRCFHFSNMRPMWGIENAAKGAKIVTNQFALI